MTCLSAALPTWHRHASRAVSPAVSSKRLRIFLLLSVLVFSKDRLDQIPDMGVDVLERLFVRSPNFLGGPLDSRRVFYVPVEGHRLGWRRRENSLGLFSQRHDHVVVLQIGHLAEGFRRLPRKIDFFLGEKADRAAIDRFGIQSGAAKQEFGSIE